MGIYDSDTIQNLKSRIESKCHIQSSQQLLLLQKQTLWHDHRTLRQYRIHDGTIIILKIYSELKIKKLRQQYIFRKSIDKAYKALEIERSATDISESDLRSEIDAKHLYELAYREEIEWQNLDEWMSKKLRKYLYEIQERSIKEKSLMRRSSRRGRNNNNNMMKESSQSQSSHNWESLNSTSKPSKPPRVNSMSTIEEVKESKSEKSSQNKSPSRTRSKSPKSPKSKSPDNEHKNDEEEENKYNDNDIDDMKYGVNNNNNNNIINNNRSNHNFNNNNNSNNINVFGNTFMVNIAPSDITRKLQSRDPYKYQASRTHDKYRDHHHHHKYSNHHHHRPRNDYKSRNGRTRALSNTRSRDKESTYHRHRESKHVEFLDFPSTTDHRYRQFMYKDCLFCCHDGTKNVKIYIAIFFIFALVLSGASYFTYDQHKRLEESSRDYYTNSTCHIYNESYAIWVAYDEYNGRVDCRNKKKDELKVNDWHGDIENIPYPNNNNYGSSTNKYIYDNDNNFTSTFTENYNYIEYHCYVTQDCSLIAISTKGESDLENPYTWDSSVIYVLTVFIWICSGLCLLTAIYLHFGYKFKRKKFLKTEWIETPPDCKCQYYVKYTQRKLEMEEKIPTKIQAIIYRYYYQEIEPSKSSKSVASTQIIYNEKSKSKSKSKSNHRTLQRPRNQTVTMSATDKTASSDDKTASRDSKSL